MQVESYSFFIQTTTKVSFGRNGVVTQQNDPLQEEAQNLQETQDLIKRLSDARETIKDAQELEIGLNKQFKASGLRFSLIDLKI